MILIAVYGEDIKIPLTVNSQIWCDSAIKELFKDISTNLCCSLDHYLPLISEAAPLAFIESIEKTLADKLEVILGMFKEVESGMIEDGTAIGDGLATAASRLKDSENLIREALADGLDPFEVENNFFELIHAHQQTFCLGT